MSETRVEDETVLNNVATDNDDEDDDDDDANTNDELFSPSLRLLKIRI